MLRAALRHLAGLIVSTFTSGEDSQAGRAHARAADYSTGTWQVENVWSTYAWHRSSDMPGTVEILRIEDAKRLTVELRGCGGGLSGIAPGSRFNFELRDIRHEFSRDGDWESWVDVRMA